MKAGRRDKRVTLERFTATTDEYNEEIETWQPLGARWAQVWMGKGSERRELAAERGRQAATFGLLSFGDSVVSALTIKDRIQYAGSNWDIEGVAPDTPERGEVEITAVRES